ncbi:MAG: Rpn family recombination-promoting nuclease/putative transposase [Arsenophonus sp. NC-PE1-MAG3]
MAFIQKHLERGIQKLLVVFPILFYYGKQSHNLYSTNWLDYFSDMNNS